MNSEDTLLCESAADWERWLEENHQSASGVWLRLANAKSGKKRVVYSDLLEVALCFGWIDALRKSDGPEYYLQRFTPRKPRSLWSKINRDRALALIAAGKMRAAGLLEVERAKQNGRWDNAYAGRKTMEVPADFAAALKANARARVNFQKLDGQNRFAFLFRLQSSLKPETRAKKLKKYIAMLSAGELIYPKAPGS